MYKGGIMENKEKLIDNYGDEAMRPDSYNYDYPKPTTENVVEGE